MAEHRGINFAGWMIGCAIICFIVLPVLAFAGCIALAGIGAAGTAGAAIEEVRKLEEAHDEGLHIDNPSTICPKCND